MKPWMASLILLCVCTLNPAISPAISLIDTGPGPNSQNGLSLNSGQWLATRLSLETAHTITSIEGWISANPARSHELEVIVFDDQGNVPGNEIFASPFVANPVVQPNQLASWSGLTGLDLDLSAGVYWVTFAVRTSNFSGAMPSPSTHPWPGAWTNNQGLTWSVPDAMSIGVRIEGNPVPLPAALPLFVVGFVGLIGLGITRSADHSQVTGRFG